MNLQSRHRRRHTSPGFFPNRNKPASAAASHKLSSRSAVASPGSVQPASTEARIPTPPIPRWKRAFDLFVVIFLFPFLLIVSAGIYCWIRLVSPGSVLFTQTRVGLDGNVFKIYKFRSMVPGAPTSLHEKYVAERMRSGLPMPKLDLAGDVRLIKGGRLMRMSGLDELPQLINVLRGEMSLVGPRPCTPTEYAEYESNQRHRFSVHPGLTGLWQVRRDPSTTFPQMIELDEDYIFNRSAALDFKIIIRTPSSLLAQMRESGTFTGSRYPNSGFTRSSHLTQKS